MIFKLHDNCCFKLYKFREYLDFSKLDPIVLKEKLVKDNETYRICEHCQHCDNGNECYITKILLEDFKEKK